MEMFPFGDEVLVVSPELAAKIGLNEALIVQQIHYWTKINADNGNNFKDGYYWTYNSYRKWGEQFPFWSMKTIARTIKKLEKAGLLITGNFNKLRIDKTKWYRINYCQLYTLKDNYTPQPDEATGEQPINLQHMPYNEYLKTEHWKKIRKRALKKAKYACRLCNSKENLNVHHRTYKRKGAEIPSDIIVLCESCHGKFHDKVAL